MIELYLDNDITEQLLNWEFEHSERAYDDVMYYMTTKMSQILYDVIYGIMYNLEERCILERMGFKSDDLDIIEGDDVNIKFTNRNNYYIKEVDYC